MIWIATVTLGLAACAATPGSSSRTASESPSPSVSASATASVPSAEPSASEVTPIGAVLPSEIGGVELHTFPVGEDILARLAARLSVATDELEAAFASDHGARFVQMYAVRLPGTTADALADAWGAVAYPPDVADVGIAEETMNGRPIIVVDSPSTASRLGTFYLDRRGETLIVVQAFDLDVAVAALASMP